MRRTGIKVTLIPLLAVVLAVVAMGCAGDGVGLDENGNRLTEGRGGELLPTWQSIQDNIFTPRCSWCHPQMGLDLSEAASYDLLVNVPSTEQPSVMRVLPGDPDNSYIIWKLEGDARITGVRMPADEKYLTQEQVDVIRQWITDGAQRTGGGNPTPPTVTALSPSPGSTLSTGPATITATFSKGIDAASVTTSSFVLIRSGGDGTFGDGNEVSITPVSVNAPSPTTATMDLSGASLVDDIYQVRLAGEGPAVILESTGVSALDGEFSGTFPSGDGTAGGDFTATFTVSASVTVTTVTALAPAPGTTLSSVPTSLTATFSQAMNAATVTTSTFQLVRSGGDGTFSDGNEVIVTPAWVSLPDPTSGVMGLTGVSLPNDVYQVTLLASGGSPMTDTNGNALDGEYSGTFPSGDGTAGGDLVATFTVAVAPTVTALSPAPGAVLASSPASITATFSQVIKASTVNVTTLVLRASGGDGTFGDGNETVITPSSVSLTSATVATIDLSTVTLLPETYQITLVGTGATRIEDTSGNALDGEYTGSLPSGDGTAGGDFVSTFSISTSVTPTTVTGINPASGSSLGTMPSTIVATFSQNMSGATVTTSTFLLTMSGGDGTFGDGNEVSVTPNSVSLTSSTTATMDLAGATLVDDTYRVTLVGTGASAMQDGNGNDIDGDNDGSVGGDFTSTFGVSLLPQWRSIQDHVFTPICTVCHIDGGPNGLDLDEANSYANLVNVNSEDFGATYKRITPGNPDDSYVIMKLEGDPRINGKRMPRNGPPYLTQQTIGVIRQWITDGADP